MIRYCCDCKTQVFQDTCPVNSSHRVQTPTIFDEGLGQSRGLTQEEFDRLNDPNNWDANPPDLNPGFNQPWPEDFQREMLDVTGDTPETRASLEEMMGFPLTV